MTDQEWRHHKYTSAMPIPEGTPCLICGDSQGTPFNDHCHKHRWVRGPLCRRCNNLMAYVDKGSDPADLRMVKRRKLDPELFREHALRCLSCSLIAQGLHDPYTYVRPEKCLWPTGCDRELPNLRGAKYCRQADQPGSPVHTAAAAGQLRLKLGLQVENGRPPPRTQPWALRERLGWGKP